MPPQLPVATADTTDGVRALLGPGAHVALGRGEVEPAFRACVGGGELGVIVRLLLLGATEPAAAVAAALGPARPGRRGRGRAAGPRRRRLARRTGPAPVRRRRPRRAGLRVVGALGPRPAPPGARPRHGRRVGVADPGRGQGAPPRRVAAGPEHRLRRAGPARHSAYTGTDLAPGALARATFTLNELDVELLDGVAQLLGSWLHVRGEDWPDRVRMRPADALAAAEAA